MVTERYIQSIIKNVSFRVALKLVSLRYPVDAIGLYIAITSTQFFYLPILKDKLKSSI